MLSPSRELLICAPERWDESCFSVPAVRALAASGLGIGVLCKPHQKVFWETLPGLEVITPQTLSEQWKVALLWEPGDLAKLVRRAGIHKRIGPSVGKLHKQLTEQLKGRPHVTEHRVQFYLKAVAEMGVPTTKPEFFEPAGLDVAQGQDSILLVPDSDFGSSHEWSLQNWQILADKLKESHSLAIARLEGGRNLGEQLADYLGGKVPTAMISLQEPPLDLIASQPTIIAADGSVPHIASHLGSSCITLFGPNDSTWKRPLGKRHRVARHHVECAPCFAPCCPLDMRCQKELEVAEVIAGLKALTFSRS